MHELNLVGVCRYYTKLFIIQTPAWILLNLYLGLVVIGRVDWATITVSSSVGLILSMVVGTSNKLLGRRSTRVISRAVLVSATLIAAAGLWYLSFALIARHWSGFSTGFVSGIIIMVGAFLVISAQFGLLRVLTRLRNRQKRLHAQRANEAFLVRQKVFLSSAPQLSICWLLKLR